MSFHFLDLFNSFKQNMFAINGNGATGTMCFEMTEKVGVRKSGGGGGFRTPGPRLMSPLLYHLSYTATFMNLHVVYNT